MTRYDRQIRVPAIGRTGQEKIQQATVLIVGCGALGTYSAEQLVRAGIKKVILIDPDVVEKTNLQRQTLFTEADARSARPKVVAAKEKLQQINTQTEIEIFQETFDQALFREFGQLDLLLDCTDNFLARQVINEYCLQFKLPFIFASCASTTGQVMAVHPTIGPCLQCIFPQLHELEEKGCETLGVFTPLVPLVSSSQVSLALRYLVAPEKMRWDQMHLLESWPLAQQTFTIKKRVDCPVCQAAQQKIATPQIFEACGKVFQVTLPKISLQQVADFCQLHDYPYQKNALAVQFRLNEQTVTSFKNGQVLFYGYQTKTQVAQTLTSLQTALQTSSS